MSEKDSCLKNNERPGEKDFLKTYDINKYFRPSVSSDIVAVTIRNKEEENYRKESETSLSILMIKRGKHPFKDSWALPGGFLRENESIEECAFREIMEETNIKPISMKPVGIFSECGRDPRGRIISIAFTCIIHDGAEKIVGGDDAAEAKWFDIKLNVKEDKYYLTLTCDDIKLSAALKETRSEFGAKRFEIVENDGFAFDHASIISTAIFDLRKDVLDFEILFDFLPKKFTLYSLQKVQETILDKAELAANFRRKVADYVQETEEFTTGAGHRPAKLFMKAEK